MDSDRFCKFIAAALLASPFLVAGCRKTPHVTLACEAAPPAVYPGEPVAVNATAGSVSTRKHVSVLYDWTGTGVTGDGPAAHVSTDALGPGTYTVNGEVKEGKRGKEGRKPEQTATCSTTFKVKEFEPPTVTYSANPSNLLPGGTSNITCTGRSPQDRPLTYSYSASAGVVTGTGTTAIFSVAGAPAGPVSVICNVKDDKNHSVSADIPLTVQTPPPPPIPHVQSLCSLSFERDKRRPTRVSNEAKACLDEIALNLQANPDAKTILVADSNADEKETTTKQEQHAAKHKRSKVEHFAEQRAVNAKEYLVQEKGIDASRVALGVGPVDDRNVYDYFVPAGASVSSDLPAITWINESAFTPEQRKPLPIHRRASTPAE